MLLLHKILLKILVLTVGTLLMVTVTFGQGQPNILWLVIEDTSPYLLPAYGNELIKTPNLDFIQQNGVVFENAYAPAPHCSPARSSLISGCDATTFGTDIHREGRPVPDFYFFPTHLRNNGYYCVNAGKTDYNIPKPQEAELLQPVWNANRSGATYNDPKRNSRPFFAQFNNMTTHMSRMTTVTLDVRQSVDVEVAGEDLPPYLPDLPETRADYALHLEGVQNTDRWVGLFLDDLRERNLLENTIIFFFSDHGGSLPRGKAFPYDTGHRAALLAYVPQRWQYLWDEQPGTRSDRLVTFTDFGPTALSLAGIKPPAHMQGKPFMGEYREAPRKYAHCFRTNTGPHFDPSRSVYDDRFHYIRYYTPYKIHGLRQGFQWGMPAQLAWDTLFHFGKIATEHKQYYQPKPYEMLFDLQADPWEMNNLANNPSHQAKLQELSMATVQHQEKINDLGFFPRENRQLLVANGGNLYDHVRDEEYPLEELRQLAAFASDAKKINGGYLEAYLNHSKTAFRFWAASGFAYLYFLGDSYPVPKALRNLVEDSSPSVAATAAEALVYAGEVEAGVSALIAMCAQQNGAAVSTLEEIQHQVSLSSAQIRRLQTIVEYQKHGADEGFAIRSILINAGELPLDSLFTEEKRRSFRRGYQQRIREWAPTSPN